MPAPASTEAVPLSIGECRAILQQAPLMIWRSDLGKGCDYFNGPWLEFRGRSFEQERGDGWAEGVHPKDLDRCLRVYTSCFDKREAFSMEYRLRRRDGEYRWILDRGVPWFDDQGRFRGFIGSCTDINELVMARELMQQRHQHELQRLRGLLPICASCKRIKDDRGYWEQLESYLCSHSEVEFTHGFCPDCAQRFMDEARAQHGS